MHLLLVNPRYRESFWSFKWAVEEILPGKRAINPPLGLATLAALCPESWEVEIVDENVEPLPLAPRADVVGVGGMGVQFKRQKELLQFYRSRGHYVVAGGSYASLCPELYAELADTVICGEAEYIWKQFCRDFEAGAPLPLYREMGAVSLADSPTPRFDLLQLDKYTTATLQFSRGCPYRCEFCDIIVMFGRKPRHKSPEQVGRELDELRLRNVRNVFFVDDNLIGHRAAARDLLRFLARYQEEHGYAFRFGTEASLNLAQDAELLRLFREANFTWVFIGIESPDPQTLKDTRKTQNVHEDVLTSVRKIYAHGIDVLAGFIVGFDNDTLETFEQQHRFITASGIQAAMVGLLTALPRTPLYERLQKEGRLISNADHTDNTKPGTNFIPKNMGYSTLVEAYQALYRRLLSDRGIAERIKNKMRFLARPVYHGEYELGEKLAIVGRLIAKGILPGGLSRGYHFLRSLPWFSPAKLPLAVVDWIAGLSMRNYMERHFSRAGEAEGARTSRLVAAVQKACAAYLRAGGVTLALKQAAAVAPEFSICFKGQVDRVFFRRAARHLKRLLKGTSCTVTLRIEQFHERELTHLHRLLEKLKRYGDRVFIVVDEKLRSLVPIDSSVFNLVLSGSD